MIEPMTCKPLLKSNVRDDMNWQEWCIEEKFDGHRLMVEVEGARVTAWTRRGAAGKNKTGDTRELPAHLVKAFQRMHDGVYDGELVAGDISTDVTRTDLTDTLKFVCFDVVMNGKTSLMKMPGSKRRQHLESLEQLGKFKKGVLELAERHYLDSIKDVQCFVEKVWSRGGEGAILKKIDALYFPGKRSKDWAKVKKLLTTVIIITGFEASRGEVFDRGPYAVVVGKTKKSKTDPGGIETTCKTKNDEELAKFNKWKGKPEKHPAIGKELRVEFQDYTRDGNLRGPVVWDRWENE